MRHPSEGVLRRLVDEPSGVPDADRRHAHDCPACASTVVTLRRDAVLAEAALAVNVDVDVERGWQRLSRGTTVKPVRASRIVRWRTALRSPVIAVAGVVALLAGAGVAAATDWLPIFRTEQIAPVSVSGAELVRLPDLSGFGDLTVTEKPGVREVADAAAAQAATGLTVPQVTTLPKGVTGVPAYRAGGRASAVFTFSAAKTAQTATAAGQSAPPPPSGLDGSQFRLVAGPGLAAIWSTNGSVPSLIVARMVAPTAYSSGIPFATARDYLLSLSLLPQDVAAQLRTFSGDGTTLPLLISSDAMTSATADVGGVPATVVTARSGVVAAVVWVDHGVITAVAGSVSADEVLAVARGLR